jgi:hypothetical protein
MVRPRYKNGKFSGREPKETNAENSEVSSKIGWLKPDLKINQVLSFVEESQNSQNCFQVQEIIGS